MGSWGAENFGSRVTSLEHAVRALNPKAKKAIYAAAQANTIRQKTWDGCAFNAAGVVVGNSGINSTQAAASTFDLPVSVVSTFIQTWDALQADSEEEATLTLIDTIEKVGLFTEPNQRISRVVRKTVYKATETKLMREFKEDLDAGKLEEDVCQAGSLLFA